MLKCVPRMSKFLPSSSPFLFITISGGINMDSTKRRSYSNIHQVGHYPKALSVAFVVFGQTKGSFTWQVFSKCIGSRELRFIGIENFLNICTAIVYCRCRELRFRGIENFLIFWTAVVYCRCRHQMHIVWMSLKLAFYNKKKQLVVGSNPAVSIWQAARQ